MNKRYLLLGVVGLLAALNGIRWLTPAPAQVDSPADPAIANLDSDALIATARAWNQPEAEVASHDIFAVTKPDPEPAETPKEREPKPIVQPQVEPEPEPVPPEEDEPTPIDTPSIETQQTFDDMTLLGTVVTDQGSVALIQSEGQTQTYRIGDVLAGTYEITHIRSRQIDIRKISP